MTETDEAPHTAILLLEDEMALGETVSSLLNEAGYSVLGPFRTVLQSVDACRAQKPAAAVLDILLERGTGYALADYLIFQRVPLVFYTALDVAEIPEWYRQHAIVPKLRGPQALLDAVAKVL